MWLLSVIHRKLLKADEDHSSTEKWAREQSSLKRKGSFHCTQTEQCQFKLPRMPFLTYQISKISVSQYRHWLAVGVLYMNSLLQEMQTAQTLTRS
jgi:hypothetical protein